MTDQIPQEPLLDAQIRSLFEQNLVLMMMSYSSDSGDNVAIYYFDPNAEISIQDFINAQKSTDLENFDASNWLPWNHSGFFIINGVRVDVERIETNNSDKLAFTYLDYCNKFRDSI